MQALLRSDERSRRQGLHGLARPPLRVGWALVEVLVLSLGAVVIGLWVSPDDPLFVHAAVPWSWMAPLLLALRYGMLSGLGSMAILLAAWELLVGGLGLPRLEPQPLPSQFFIGGLLLTMVCGEFSGAWRSRINRLLEANGYLEDRVERVMGRLYMVQRSHDLLQQELLQRPTTLRHALEGLQRRALVGDQAAPAAAQAFLDHLASSCQLEGAQIVALGDADAHGAAAVDGLASGMLLAQLGDDPLPELDDPLVRFAIASERLAHLQIGLPDDTAPTRYLVAAPLRIGQARSAALLVISRMPFMALHEETLRMIAVLCAAFSSAADVARDQAQLLAELPGCPMALAEELCRLDHLAREFQITSHLVLLRFDDPARAIEQAGMAERRARAPDVIWPFEAPGERRRLLTLMPLTGREAVEGYLSSVTELITARYPRESAGVNGTGHGNSNSNGTGTGTGGLGALGIGAEVLALGQGPLGASVRAFIGERG